MTQNGLVILLVIHNILPCLWKNIWCRAWQRYNEEEKKMAKKIVLAGACRTAIGTMGGELSTVPAPELGAIVIKEALKRAGVAPEAVDQVYMGCVIQAGQGQNVARQATLKAGLPIEVPAVTINVVCGSGLEAVNMAAEMILSGDADIVVAGGMENMSMAPYAMMKGVTDTVWAMLP